MNIKIDTERIVTFVKANYKYLPAFTAGVVILTFAILTYFAIHPRQDAEKIAEGEEKVESLDIRFNTKLLTELGTTKAPTQLGTAGGRDPFSGF